MLFCDGVLRQNRFSASNFAYNYPFSCCRKSLTGPVLQQSVQVADLLSPDEFRWFWITWSDGVITFGKWDHDVGHDDILRYSDNEPSAVNYISVGSAEFFSSDWIIPSQYYDIGITLHFVLFATYYWLTYGQKCQALRTEMLVLTLLILTLTLSL